MFGSDNEETKTKWASTTSFDPLSEPRFQILQYPFRFSIKFYLLVFFLCFVDQLVLFDNFVQSCLVLKIWWQKKKKNSSFQIFNFFLCFNHFVGFFFFMEKMLEEIKNSISLMLCHFHALRSTVFDFSYFLLCFHSFIYLFIFVSLESTFVFITSSSLANCKLYVSVYYI